LESVIRKVGTGSLPLFFSKSYSLACHNHPHAVMVIRVAPKSRKANKNNYACEKNAKERYYCKIVFITLKSPHVRRDRRRG